MMRRILLSSIWMMALWIGYAQASDLQEEESSPILTQLLEKHLDHPLHSEDIVHIRSELGKHILKMIKADPSPQKGWAKVYIESLEGPTQPYYISQAMAKKILHMDDHGNFKVREKAPDSEFMSAHRTTHFGGIYFKQHGENAIAPGMEFSMYSFYGMLVGQILAPSCLMVLRQVQSACEDSFFVQASQLIPGKTLEYYLKAGQAPLIEEGNLSRFITGSWLSNPTDYKPDNMVVYRKGEKNYLVGIDNDLSLRDPIVNIGRHESEHILEVKQILYCIPSYMTQVFHNQVRNHLGGLSPLQFLFEWLQVLQAQNQRYQQLVEAKALYEADLAEHNLNLPIRLLPSIIERVLTELSLLQSIIGDSHGISHGEAWKRLQPLPHFIYHSIEKQSSTPLDCLKYLYDIEGRGYRRRLETYLPLNHYLTQYERRDGWLVNRSKRIYHHLRGYQNLVSEELFPLEETAFQLLKAVSPSKLTSSQRLKLFQFLGEYFPQVLMNSAPQGWRDQKVLQELYNNATLSEKQVHSLLQLGLDLSALSTGSQEPELHRLLQQGIKYHQHIRALLQKGIDIDEMNQEGMTALDVALQQEDLPSIKLLLELGATKAKTSRLMSFYKKVSTSSEWQGLFYSLRDRHNEFCWQSMLWHMLPPLPGGKHEIPSERQAMFVSLRPAQRYLGEGVWQQVLTQQSKIIQANTEGRRVVAKALWQDGDTKRSLYLKFYPELPGFETSMSLLMNRYLFGFGVPYSELILLGGIPCLLSQGIEGDSLLTTLQKYPNRLKKLDSYSTSSLIIGTLLMAPEDGKPDNYIMEPFGEDHYRLIAIDNDHGLADPLAQEVVVNRLKCCPQVKSILYCLDQMHDPLHPEVRQKILSINFFETIESWLLMLDGVQKEYNAAFPNAQQVQRFYRDEKNPCFIGVPFKTEMIAKLYDRCVRLQSFLTEHLTPSHAEILQAVEPVLYHRYRLREKSPLSVLERFEQIDGKYFLKSQTGQYMTTSNLEVMLTGLKLDVHKLEKKKTLIEDVRKAKGIGPAQALLELQQEEKVIGQKDLSLQQFKALKREEARAQFLDQLKLIPVSLQQSWLEEIRRVRLRQLNLSAFAGSSNEDVVKRSGLHHLTHLNLRNSQKITNELIGFLEKNCPHLMLLDLSNTQLTQFNRMEGFFNPRSFPVTFNDLKVLRLEECSKLLRIELNAPQLLEMDLREATSLSEIKGDFSKLVYLDLRNAKKFPQHIFDAVFENRLDQFKTLNLFGCSQLKYVPVSQFTGDGLKIYRRVSQLKGEILSLLGELHSQDPTLQTLIVCSEQYMIGPDGVQALAEILKVTSTLRTLQIYRNEIEADGVQALGEAMKVNSTLQVLKLQGTWISDGGAQELGEALKVNSTLQELNLFYNHIGDGGAQVFAEALKVNSTLRELVLRHNQISDGGAQALAEALKMNSTLQTLDLEENKIGDGGAQALAEALKVNSTLRTLELRGKIGKEIDNLLKGRKVPTQAVSSSSITSPPKKIAWGSEDMKELLQKLKVPTQTTSSLTTSTPEAIELNSEEINEGILVQLLQPPLAVDPVEEDLSSLPSMNPWSYTILSINGGGMRGLIPALVLEKLQDYAGNAYPLHSLFDYMGGSSIGGLLSLGIVVPQVEDDTRPRYPIHELINLFTHERHRIFSLKTTLGLKQLFTTQYNAKPLEGLLKEYFGEASLSSALTPTLVTAFVNHSKDYQEGFQFLSTEAQIHELDDYLMWEVARSTSVAPTYFPGYRLRNILGSVHNLSKRSSLSNRLYVNENQTTLHDGSLWAHNPTKLIYDVLKEAHSYSEVPVTSQNSIVVSLGTGSLGGLSLSFDIQGGIENQDANIDAYFKQYFGENYYRFQPTSTQGIEFDETRPKAIEKLKEAAKDLLLDSHIEDLARCLVENKANRHVLQLE